MPSLTAQATTFRTTRYTHRAYLSYLPQTVIFQALVNGTPAFSTTGSIQTVTVDTVTVGAITDVREGMTVEFLDGSGISRGKSRVATGGGSGTTLQIAELSQGVIAITDNWTVKVFGEFRIWDRLVSATAALNKDSRIAYTDAGSNPPPVANCGGLWAGFVDSSSVTYATVTFDASVSFVIDPDSAGTLTYLWAVGDGTITVGSTTTAGITVRFPEGFRHVTLTVTDSGNSKSTVRYVPVWVHSTLNTDSDYPKSVLCNSRSYTDEGWSFDFELPVGSEASLSNIPDGALVVLWEDNRYGSTNASYGSNVSGRSHIRFVGYLDRDQIEVDADNDTVTFTAVSPLGILADTGALPQLTIQKAAPTKWTDIKGNSIYRTLFYLWQWHTTAFLYFDFRRPSSGDLAYTRLATTVTSNQLEQFRDIADSMGLVVTCDWLGRLIVDKNPMYEDSTERTARTKAYDFTSADYVRVEWERPHRIQTKTVIGEGITDGSTAATNVAIFARAPGTAPASASGGADTFDRQIVDNQAELNERTGLRFAEVNSLYNGRIVPKGLRLTLRGGYDVIDPALQEWVTITLPATANKRGVAFDSTARWLVKGAEVTYDAEAGTKEVVYTLDHETTGADAYKEVRKQKNENGLPNFPGIDLEIPGIDLPPIEVGDPLTLGSPILAAWAVDGYVYLTATGNNPFASGGPVWTRTQLSGVGMSGTFNDFVVDAYSPKYLGTGTAVNGWLVTTTNIYRVTDVFGSIALASQHTFVNTANLIHRSIDASFGFAGWVGVASTYTTNGATAGTQWTYTTDSGSTWTNVSVATGGTTNVPSAIAWPGLHVSSNVAGLCYVSAVTAGSAGTRQLWRSLDYGATWAQVTPAIQAGATIGNAATLHVPFHDNPGDKLIFLSARLAVNNTYADMTLATAQVGVTGATDITPGAGGPGVYRRALTTLGNNRQIGAFIERVDGAGGSRNLWITTSGGETLAEWVNTNNIEAASAGYAWDSVALVGGPNNPGMYLWGEGGIAYSPDMGLTYDDRRGNMGTLGIGTSQIVNICGG
jgi:hypothetical protein